MVVNNIVYTFYLKKMVREWWQEGDVGGLEGHKCMRKSKFLKEKLKIWNKEVLESVRLRKVEISKQLKELDRLTV